MLCLSEHCQWSRWHSSRILNGSCVCIHTYMKTQHHRLVRLLSVSHSLAVFWLRLDCLNNIHAHSLGCVWLTKCIVFRHCASLLFPVELNPNEGASLKEGWFRWTNIIYQPQGRKYMSACVSLPPRHTIPLNKAVVCFCALEALRKMAIVAVGTRVTANELICRAVSGFLLS